MVAATAPIAYRRFGRFALLWCGVAPLVALIWLLANASTVIDGGVITASFEWVPQLGLDMTLRLDGFGLLMGLLITGIGVLVFAYATSYFAGHESPRVGMLALWLTIFAGAMLGLVLADDVYMLFLCWELTSITSFFLIGFHDDQASSRGAARQALLVTSAGGLALLGGLVLISQAAGTTSLSSILASPPPTDGVVVAALVLILLGAFTKSAQAPFHFWLPGAMVAPTPVSTYLHSATMVKAGVYLVARFAPAFADVGFWRPLVITVGLTTMAIGACRSLVAHDLKQILAFGTVSQLGLLIALFGSGRPELVQAACLLLVAHALAKAALFMAVGIIDHQAHTRDIRRLDGLWRRLPVLATVTTVAALSLAGVWPLLGFFAKEEALAGLYDQAFPGATATLVVVAVLSALTFGYTARFVWGAFATKARGELGHNVVGPEVPRPSALFLVGPSLLAAAGVVAATMPSGFERTVWQAAQALDPLAELHSVAFIPYAGPVLGISLGVIGGGICIFLARSTFENARPPAWVPSSTGAYEATLRGLNVLADRTTSIVQHGSLPLYIGVVLATFLALPGVALAARVDISFGTVDFSPLQFIVAVVVLVAAAVTVAARVRLAAVIGLGAVGYGIAVMWILEGAPDLAITQLLIETLTVVIFVLVLRKLPERFAPARRGQSLRVAISVLVGVMMTAFVLAATHARTVDPVSDEMIARSVGEGGGKNVVNIILVSIRGFDTLGEITVLVVAGLGVTSLVLAGRIRRDPVPSVGESDDDAQQLDAEPMP